MVSDFEFGFTTGWVCVLALTSAKASQISWCVIKLSLLQRMKKPKQLQHSQNPSTIALTNWTLNQTSKAKAKQEPREQSPTIAFVLLCATNLGMGFPIRPYCVLLGALIAFPLLLTVFHREMLLYPYKIAQSSRWIMVHTRWFWTHIHLLFHILAWPLTWLPRKIVASLMKLQILFPLKPFLANFTNKFIRRQ